MQYLFNECYKLKEIKGINNFNTINVTNMSYMFNECHKLREIKGIYNFNTINVNNIITILQ